MAELRIDAKVSGIDQVKALDKAVKDVEKSAESVEVQWGKFLTRLGAVTAAAYAFSSAMKSLTTASREYNQTAEEIAATAKRQELGWTGLKAAMADWLGVAQLAKAHNEAALLGQQRLTAWITGESLEAIQAEQEMMLESIDIKEMMGDAVDNYIDKLDEQGDAEEALWAAQEEYQEQGFLEYQKQLAEETERLAKAEQARLEIIEQFTNYASGRNPSAQLWQSTWEGDDTAPAETVTNTDALDKNTKALEENSRTNDLGYQSPQYTYSGGPEATPYGARSGSRRDFYTPTGGSWGLKGKERPSWYGSQHFTGTLQGPEQRVDDSAERREAARIAGEQERYAEALAEATQALEDAYANLDKWTDFLILSQNILADVNSGLQDMVSNLESISNSFTDYYSQAREALYGGTDQSLGYAEAKANAEAAWDVYQTDTWNQEYIDDYNARMDELIGTLEDFHDTTLYEAKRDQDWAKATALYEISQMQEAQDIQEEEINEQIELLKQMVALSEVQNDATDAANALLDQIETETKEGKDATYLVQDAVSDVELATKQVELANAEIELKKTEKFNLESVRWSQTGSDVQQVWTGETEGIGQKIYETVVVPTFGYVTETGDQIGFKSGGYTGDGSVNAYAGAVHGQEYVINAQTTADLGLNGTGGVFQQMNNKLDLLYNLYEINKTSKRTLAIQADTRNILETSENVTT